MEDESNWMIEAPRSVDAQNWAIGRWVDGKWEYIDPNECLKAVRQGASGKSYPMKKRPSPKSLDDLLGDIEMAMYWLHKEEEYDAVHAFRKLAKNEKICSVAELNGYVDGLMVKP